LTHKLLHTIVFNRKTTTTTPQDEFPTVLPNTIEDANTDNDEYQMALPLVISKNR